MLNIFKKGHRTLTSDLETWAVRWNQRYGDYSGQYKQVAQFFTNKEEAEAFKESLMRATSLLGHTSTDLTWIKLEKMKNGL
jgi:hypothetical protein